MPEDLTRDVEDLRNEIGEALHDVRVALAGVRSFGQSPAAASASNSNTNHFGGVGLMVSIIVCTVCCTAMLTGGAVFAYMTSNQVAQQNGKIAALESTIAQSNQKTDEKLSRMQDYLNAIYSIAPQLKPKEK